MSHHYHEDEDRPSRFGPPPSERSVAAAKEKLRPKSPVQPLHGFEVTIKADVPMSERAVWAMLKAEILAEGSLSLPGLPLSITEVRRESGT